MSFEIQSGVIEKPQKVVIYGPEGVGKSTLASQFPNPLFIDTEDSTLHMNVQRLKRPTTYTELSQMVKWVGDNKPCSTLVIDTADWAQRLVEQHVLSVNGWKSIEDPGYGEGYLRVKEFWERLLDDLTDYVINKGINVVLTAHTEVRKFDDPKEAVSYDRYELKLAKKSNANIAALTKEWADMILFINYDTYAVKREGMGSKHIAKGGERKIFTEHHPAFDAKNRHGLPKSMPLSYEGIAHTINDFISQQPQAQPSLQPVAADPAPAPVQPQETQPEQPVQPAQPEQSPVDTTIDETFDSLQAQASQIDAKFENDPFEDYKVESALPKELTDLMSASGVTEDEIRGVMGVRGHYPINTPFETIASTQPEYFTGGLVANWDGVMQVVQDIRNNPKQLVDLYTKAGETDAETIVSNLNINQ